MKVLGLDVATKTGFAIIDESGIINSGIIQLNPKVTYRERLKFLREQVLELLINYKPDIVALETVYAVKHKKKQNVKTVAVLNWMRGVVMESIPRNSELIDVYATTARKDVIGSGRATKEDVFNWAVKEYELDDFVFSKHNDVTDAILLARWAMIQHKEK